MIPLFIPSHFGEHYQVLAWGQVSFPSGEVVTTTDAARLFSIITRELTIPAEQWRGVLMRLGISIPPNFFHTADIYHELVKLFQRRQLQLVKIPRLEQLLTIKAEEGWGYCFTQGPHLHPSLSYSSVTIHSLEDAQAWLSNIKISEKALSQLLPSSSVGSIEKLAELLANHSVIAYKIPVHSAAPSVKPVEFLPAAAADKPVPLGPESKPQPTTVKPEPSAKDNVEPPREKETKTADGKRIHYFKQEDVQVKKLYGGDEYFFFVEDNGDILELAYTTVDATEESLEFYINNQFNDNVLMKPDGFGLTSEVLSRSVDLYANDHGSPPGSLNGVIIKKNLSNFQCEYNELRTKLPNMSHEEIATAAVKRISFGRERVKLGYSDIQVSATVKKDVLVEGKLLHDVPTKVQISAKRNRGATA